MEEIHDVLECGMTDAEALQYAIDIIEFQQRQTNSEPELDMAVAVLTEMLVDEVCDM
jgi:hypothetical protein